VNACDRKAQGPCRNRTLTRVRFTAAALDKEVGRMAAAVRLLPAEKRTPWQFAGPSTDPTPPWVDGWEVWGAGGRLLRPLAEKSTWEALPNA